MSKTEMYRISFSDLEILELVDILNHQLNTHGLNDAGRDALFKIKKWELAINMGKKPSYVASGTRTQQSGSNTLSSKLGFTPAEMWFAALDKTEQFNIEMELADYNCDISHEQLPLPQYVEKIYAQKTGQTPQATQTTDLVVGSIREVTDNEAIAAALFGI